MFRRIIFSLGIIAFLCVPLSVARAVSVRLLSDVSFLAEGEPGIIRIVLDTEGMAINGIEGSLRIPNTLRVAEVRDAGSVINFWIKRPAVGDDGIVHFGGVTAGGFTGPEMPLFALTVVPELSTAGQAIRLETVGVRATVNDGRGTTIALPDAAMTVSVASKSQEQIPVPTETDIIPPEPFVITAAQDPSIADSLWFIVFSTQDKGSGMNRYEIQETANGEVWEGGWVIAKSPFVLRDQSRKSIVFVKAIDNAGNARTAVLSPIAGSRQYAGWLFWYILGGAGILVLFLVLILVWRQTRRHSGI